MANSISIIAGNTAPGSLAGYCPQCGKALHNPSAKEHKGLSMTLRWEISCPNRKCGARVTVENPRYL